MKKLYGIYILISICLLSFNISCSKSSDGGNNNSNGNSYIKFKVDGVAKDFRSSAQATLTNNSPGSNGAYTAIMIAFKDVSGGAVNSMSILVTSSNPIAVNHIYSDHSQYGLEPEAILSYINEVGAGYESLGTDLVPNTSINVTFTEVTSSHVKGTFSAKLFGNSSIDFHQVSEGEFSLDVK